MSVMLMKYDAARRALAVAYRVDEAKAIRDKAHAIAAYARQAKDTDMIAWATEIKVRAERRAGELLKAMPKNQGELRRGTKKVPREDLAPTLKELKISKKDSATWQQLATIPETEFERRLARRNGHASRMTVQQILHPLRGTQGTGDNEWYTPSVYVEAARAVLGQIDLDPASSAVAQRTVQAMRYLTRDADNGLVPPWHGRVWLNPPYAQPFIAQFIDKLVREVSAKHTTRAIVLTHCYTDTAWFHQLAEAAQAFCFVRGRIAFLDPQGRPAAPTQGQVFSYIGPDVHRFAEVFGKHGQVLVHA